MRKLSRILVPMGLAVFGLLAALILPIVNQTAAVVAPALTKIDPWLIAATFAQTMTLTDVTTEVGTSVTNYVPSLAIFIAAGVVFALAAFFVARLLRAGRSG
jgi:hypothetical protein